MKQTDFHDARMINDQALLKQLRRRANKARKFPVNTCPASRHLAIMAERITLKRGYPMLTEEPEHCAATMWAVLASLWEARSKLARVEELVSGPIALRDPNPFRGDGFPNNMPHHDKGGVA